MEPVGSLPHSQQPATCPYPEPDQSSPCLAIPLLEDSACVYKIKNPSALYIRCNCNHTVNKGLRTATPLLPFGLRSPKREGRAEGRGNEHISPLGLPYVTISQTHFLNQNIPQNLPSFLRTEAEGY